MNVPKNAEKYAKILFHNMSRSLVGSSHLDEKRSHGDALLWPKNAGKSGKLEVVMEKCWKIVGKIEKRGNIMEIAAKLEKKERPTNSHSIQSRHPTKPGRPTE